MNKAPIGVYVYDKRLKSGRVQRVRVTVFALEVEQEADVFPEAAERERQWTPIAEAARAVDEPELMALLATFRP